MLMLLQFSAILSVALYFVPGGAHLFELPNKLALPPAEYMAAQQIYRGWAFFGAVMVFALVSTAAHAFVSRADRRACGLSVVAVLALLLGQGIFWTFTQPMNVETLNWTIAPRAFEDGRRQWELSHAASALCTLAALASITAAALRYREMGATDAGKSV